jgi:hypothetical protein
MNPHGFEHAKTENFGGASAVSLNPRLTFAAPGNKLAADLQQRRCVLRNDI